MSRTKKLILVVIAGLVISAIGDRILEIKDLPLWRQVVGGMLSAVWAGVAGFLFGWGYGINWEESS